MKLGLNIGCTPYFEGSIVVYKLQEQAEYKNRVDTIILLGMVNEISTKTTSNQ